MVYEVVLIQDSTQYELMGGMNVPKIPVVWQILREKNGNYVLVHKSLSPAAVIYLESV